MEASELIKLPGLANIITRPGSASEYALMLMKLSGVIGLGGDRRLSRPRLVATTARLIDSIFL